MGPFVVVPADPVPDRSTCLIEVGEQMLPDTLLFERTKEPLDHAVLLRGVGSYELLAQSIVPERGPEPPALEDESVVTPYDGRLPLGSERAEAGNAGFLECAFSFLGPPPEGELIAHDLPVVAVDDGGQVAPAIGAAVDVREIHGPALVAALGATAKPTNPRPWRVPAFVTEPAFQLQDAVHGLAVDMEAVTEA